MASERDFIQEAKDLLNAKLADHPDERVRTINALCRIADDNPAVQTVAKALRDRAASSAAKH
jgi:hypothetical protein